MKLSNNMVTLVVKAEILKLLDAGVIYPITDSKWVVPIHVVPKKTGITLVKKKMMNSFLLASQVDGECVLITES